MKRTLIISNVFWVLLFSVFLFKNCTPEPSAGKCADLSKSYEKEPFTGFPGETAYAMSQTYQKNHYAVFNRNLKTPDARSAWFSLDSLKKFIWHIEKATCELKEGDVSGLGIRFYFAEYPDAETMKKLRGLENADPELAGKHTLFLVPTLQNEDGHVDFDAIGRWKSQKDRESGKSSEAKAMFLVQPEPPFGSVMNHATLCPVACGTGDLSF